jgi:acyl carrier protein
LHLFRRIDSDGYMEEIQFLALIEEVLEVDESTIDISMSLKAVEWDSLSNLTLISLLDSQYGKQIGAQQLQEAVTLSDLYALINSK